MREIVADHSAKEDVQTKLALAFRRRVDVLDIQRYRIVQRLGICLLGNDKVFLLRERERIDRGRG